MNPKEIVRRGYDLISHNYRSDDGQGMESEYELWLSEVLPLLPAGQPVLELGCGCGVPVAQLVADGFPYTGVDISAVQIERAKRLVPTGRFIRADMTELDFPGGSFAAVLSFYALIHVPLAEQPLLLSRIRRWLIPGGYFLATVGHTAWTGTEEDWLGAEMYWSHADEATYLEWLDDLGFELRWKRFVPEGDSGHTLLLATV